MHRRHRSFARAPALAVLTASLWATGACSSKSDGGLSGDDGSGSTQGDGAASSGSSSGSNSLSGDDATTGGFTATDGGGLGTGSCQTGTYTGTFACGFIYDADASGTTSESSDAGIGHITGTITFNLAQSMSGELGQDTASGHIAIDAGFGIMGDADLTGSLDCGSGAFSGSLVDGHYGWFSVNPTTNFGGPLSADYNGKTSAFVNGNWSMTIPGIGYCPGTWTASFSGPAGDQ